jgi:hypothetical protein
MASKIRTSRHLPGVISNKLARAEGSLKLGALVPLSSRRIDLDSRLRLSLAAFRLCFN